MAYNSGLSLFIQSHTPNYMPMSHEGDAKIQITWQFGLEVNSPVFGDSIESHALKSKSEIEATLTMAEMVRTIWVGFDLAAVDSPALSSNHNADSRETSSN